MRVKTKGHWIWLNERAVNLVAPRMEPPKVKGADPTPIVGVCEVVLGDGMSIVVEESYGDFTRKLEDVLK